MEGSLMELNKEFWDKSYENNQYGWDIGYPSTPLKEYFDQLIDKSIKILIPGAGHAYEAEYLFDQGFKNTFIIEYASQPIQTFMKNNPHFPAQQIFSEDFFDHEGTYNLIIEQTFLTSLPRNMRAQYSKKMHDLLCKNGKLVGLVFNHEFETKMPPYGGTPEEYIALFEPHFHVNTFEVCYNSIKPRKNREHFFILTKK